MEGSQQQHPQQQTPTSMSSGPQINGQQLAQETRQFIQSVSQQLPQQRRVSFEPTLIEATSRLEYVATGQSSQSQSSYQEADLLVKSMDGESLARHARHVWDTVKRELSSEQRAAGEDRISRVVERLEFASIGSQSGNATGQQQQQAQF